jgi:hypothetical protein
MTRPSTPRRTFLTAAVAAAAVVSAPNAAAVTGTETTGEASTAPDEAFVDYRAWITTADWGTGVAEGVATLPGPRPGIAVGLPAGTYDYLDPHTNITATWERAVWISPVRTLPRPATEVVASWNARTPPGSWIQVELTGAYGDGTTTPWYVMGRWAADDGADSIRRTSVDDQTDGRSSVSTDTLAIDTPTLPDGTPGPRLVAYRLRLTLLRKPGTAITPLVWRVGAMASDIPDRFTVPASVPGEATGSELAVPRYSQQIHAGQYPEYDSGGEAWCSPSSSQMALEFWGRRPSPQQLAWVDPAYADPQVCNAARFTYDYRYQGCGNWPFNAAYAATYHDMNAAVTRLRGLGDIERLIRAGIPVITSQSFLPTELDGAGYGTAGHLMCVVGFTPEGDVVANDPAGADDAAVRRVYKRSQFETIWLRTRRYDAGGQVRSGSGGVAYLYWPLNVSRDQRLALASLGIR